MGGYGNEETCSGNIDRRDGIDGRVWQRAKNPVNTLNDLEGKRIGVQLKTTGDSYATDIKDADVQRFNKGYDAILALRAGKSTP